jgi:hypothetical protein
VLRGEIERILALNGKPEPRGLDLLFAARFSEHDYERPMIRPVCVVVGVGPGNGAAIARRFAEEGYAVALVARTAGVSEKLASELGGGARASCPARASAPRSS